MEADNKRITEGKAEEADYSTSTQLDDKLESIIQNARGVAKDVVSVASSTQNVQPASSSDNAYSSDLGDDVEIAALFEIASSGKQGVSDEPPLASAASTTSANDVINLIDEDDGSQSPKRRIRSAPTR